MNFDLRRAVACGDGLRGAARGATSMEEGARALARFLHQDLTRADGSRVCPLVLVYKTHPYAALPPTLQALAREALGAEVAGETCCLTLLAGAADRAAWEDRTTCPVDSVVPLTSAADLASAPWVGRLLERFGLDLGSLGGPAEAARAPWWEAFDVFHVEDALESPDVPAREELVVAEAVRSVLGFGFALRSGEVFAVVLFSRLPIRSETADLFKALSLGARLALEPLEALPTFA